MHDKETWMSETQYIAIFTVYLGTTLAELPARPSSEMHSSVEMMILFFTSPFFNHGIVAGVQNESTVLLGVPPDTIWLQ